MNVGRALGLIFFLTAVLSVLAGLHYYVWARLVRDSKLPHPWNRVALVAVVLLALGFPLAIFLSRRQPEIGRFLVWPAYTWLGVVFVLFVLLVSTDLVRLLSWAVRRLGGPGAPLDGERRTLLARAVAGAATGAAAILTVGAMRSALGPVAIRKVEVKLSRLPPKLDGTTLVQLTDMHVGPTIGRAFVEDVVRRTNALSPDIVAITGDLVDGSVEDLREAVAPLADLRARHGVYFVTGNHEYFSGAREWIAELERLGLRVLRNQRVSVGEGPDSFDLAGVNDRTAARYPNDGEGENLAQALAGRDPARELVLLAHQPRTIREAERLGVGLQISGHTHGGQIWPFTYLVRLQQPFVAGLHRQGQTQIYVSCGTGYWGPPMRLGVPAEIAQLVLRAAATS
jgi:predicted MPP superfamily phosphohydrolase